MKKQNYWSQADCTRIIEENKDATNYFSRTVTMEDMWEMFRYRYGFGDAETAVILASLIKAGAKFKQLPITETNYDTVNYLKKF